MGIGFNFGPPRAGDAFRPHAGEWQSERRLDEAQLTELTRIVEAAGWSVDDRYEERSIDADCEGFVFGPNGGWLSKPSRDLDEMERQMGLVERICDWAGWVVVAEGYHYGFEREGAGYRITVSAPEPPRELDAGPFDALLAASTSGALRGALRELRAAGAELPMHDLAVLSALLLSDDESVLDRVLEGLESQARLVRTSLLDTRLRRVVMLAEDPALVERAKALRARLE